MSYDLVWKGYVTKKKYLRKQKYYTAWYKNKRTEQFLVCKLITVEPSKKHPVFYLSGQQQDSKLDVDVSHTLTYIEKILNHPHVVNENENRRTLFEQFYPRVKDEESRSQLDDAMRTTILAALRELSKSAFNELSTQEQKKICEKMRTDLDNSALLYHNYCCVPHVLNLYQQIKDYNKRRTDMKNHMLSDMKTCCSYLDIDDEILHIKTLSSITKQKDIGVKITFRDVNLIEHTILVTKVEGQNVMSLDDTNIREMLEPQTRIIQMGDIEFYKKSKIVINNGLWGSKKGTRQYSTSPETGYDSLSKCLRPLI